MSFSRWIVLFPLCAAVFAQAPVVNGTSQPAAQTQVEAEDPFGRTTPRGTVLGLIRAVQREDLARATQYLETNLPKDKAQVLAEQLKIVLDRRLFVPLNEISDQPNGNELDDDARGVERIGSVEGPAGQVHVVLHQVVRDGKRVWLFAPSTLSKIPAVYGDIDVNWVEQNLPEGLRRFRVAGIPLWRLLTFFLNLVAALLSASLAARLSSKILDRMVARLSPAGLDAHVFEIAGPIRVLFTAIAFLLVAWLSSTLVSRNFWFSTAGVCGIVGFTWLAMRVSDGIFEIVERRRASALTQGDMALRRLLQRFAKLLLVLVGFMSLLRAFGKDPTTLIAGLGVGGIAIAFAAQKTLENFFGGIMIISDRPIGVGDYCRVAGVEGTVEDIGLRSTRLRTPNRTVISIPNGLLSTQNIENFGVRDKFLLKHILSLRYETTPGQMEAVLARVESYLAEHTQIEPGTFRVRFISFNTSSLDVEIFGYVLAPDWVTHLQIQQGILLRIMEIVQECGTGFAFPSQTMYLAKDTLPGTPPSAEPKAEPEPEG